MYARIATPQAPYEYICLTKRGIVSFTALGTDSKRNIWMHIVTNKGTKSADAARVCGRASSFLPVFQSTRREPVSTAKITQCMLKSQ
mmetsp:Transcript_21990/g.32774  ORF Transcript_21990/g.32774 Transcript_21990/m.32774 type:complete len:87 (-) Transcript_21990:929-1189(-)